MLARQKMKKTDISAGQCLEKTANRKAGRGAQKRRTGAVWTRKAQEKDTETGAGRHNR